MKRLTLPTTNLLFSMLLGLAPAAHAAPAPTSPTLMLGIQNGLVQENAVALGNTAQELADVIGAAAGRKVIWEANYSKADAGKQASEGSHFDFVFSKPPNLSAALLSKGWQLVATAKSPVEFGTDFIAQPCPGKPGEVLLGGPTLAILGVERVPPATCVAAADAWKSPAALLLTPTKGSLVDKVATKLWLQRAGTPPKVIYVAYQNAVTGFMQTTHAAVIGAVTPLVSKKWKAEGGIVLAHQSMPFWALLAAPGTPAATVDKVRAAMLGNPSQRLNEMLHIPGWEAGSPKPYAEFMQWLKAKN
ncbi:conserved exported hypothetical protein [Thiomonas sp. X19]|uniref:hypothetical protein n=1 Tax=Thiomonas sp. X19 TaxID=1050370 RepID=UPI000B72F139|nr:hypothetical protein [Thiomonas sp. X19]SCC91970.1 conserved exported hypothetical protein [Thiomonas sp. X19]